MKFLIGLVIIAAVLLALVGVVIAVARSCINAFANFIGGDGVDSDNSP